MGQVPRDCCVTAGGVCVSLCAADGLVRLEHQRIVSLNSAERCSCCVHHASLGSPTGLLLVMFSFFFFASCFVNFCRMMIRRQKTSSSGCCLQPGPYGDRCNLCWVKTTKF